MWYCDNDVGVHLGSRCRGRGARRVYSERVDGPLAGDVSEAEEEDSLSAGGGEQQGRALGV